MVRMEDAVWLGWRTRCAVRMEGLLRGPTAGLA